MKINILNKIYIFIAFFLVIAIITKILNYKSWERYYFASSICTPSSYPIYLHNCYFLTNDLDDDAWIKDESVNHFSSEWGNEEFLEVYSPMRLPAKLVLQYASFSEQKFYSDTINLPEKKIKQIFENAEKNKNFENLYSSRGDKKGLHFLVGVAQNGNIKIWLRGIFLEEVILQTQIHPKEPKGDETFYEKRLPKTVYLSKVFEYLDDSLKVKINNGWEKNAKYMDTATNYIENNREMWQYQKKNKIIE